MSSELAHVSNVDEVLETSPVDIRNYPSALHMMKHNVDTRGDNVLMLWPSMTYNAFTSLNAKQVWDLGDRFYGFFKDEILHTLPPRSWVGMMLEDNGHIFWVFLALQRADMNVLMINPKQSVVSVENLMKLTGGRLLLTTKRLKNTVFHDLNEYDWKIVTHERVDIETMRGWPSSGEDLRAPRPDELEEVRTCLHSSGSTRLPSPIYLPNKRIILDSLMLALTRKDAAAEASKIIVIAPATHIMGFGYIIGASMILGLPIILLLSPRFPPSVPEIIRTIDLGGVRHLVTVPSLLGQLITSVPEASPQSQVLQQLETVTYGGAALPSWIGQKLRDRGITVMSVYGSTESGVMMKTTDEGEPTTMQMVPFASWKFVPQDGNEDTATLFELVILKNSFSLAPGVSNCDEGFATDDLFMKGPKAGEWHLIGRKGDTLVHLNGEKTNAALMEEAILSRAKGRIRHACVTGSGRQSTALLVEPEWTRVDEMSSEEIKEMAYDAAKAANAISPKHSRIMRDKILILPRDKHMPISEKGNLRRFKIVSEFAKEIESLYELNAVLSRGGKRRPSAELSRVVSESLAKMLHTQPDEMLEENERLNLTEKGKADMRRNLEAVIGVPLSISVIDDNSTPKDILNFLIQQYAIDTQPSAESGDGASLDIVSILAEILDVQVQKLESRKDDSLLDMGMTSLEAESLQRVLEAKLQVELPPNFAYEYSTVNDMERILKSFTQNSSNLGDAAPNDQDQFHYRETQALQVKYCDLIQDISLLFGGKERKRRNEERVILITGASGHLGSHLVLAAVQSPIYSKVICLLRGDNVKDRMAIAFRSRFLDVELLNNRVEFHKFNPRERMFGLDNVTYVRLQTEVTDIIHNAWSVNFNMHVRNFEEDWIKSTWNMILFALTGEHRKSLNIISSVSAIARYADASEIPEEFLGDKQVFMTLPMGYAQSKYIAEAMLAKTRELLPIDARIFRCGQICGDTQHGVWKAEEMVPMLAVKGGGELNQIPYAIDGGNLIPVDTAARSIIEIVTVQAQRLVWHISNPHGGTWTDWLDALQEAGLEFDRVDGSVFLQTLRRNPENRCNLLYKAIENSVMSQQGPAIPMSTKETQDISSELKKCPVINAALVKKFLAYWQSTKFLKASLHT